MDPAYRGLIGVCLCQKFFIAIAIIIFTSPIYSQTPRSAKDFSERGHQRYAQGDYDGAISDFTQAIDLTSRLDTKGGFSANNFRADPRSSDAAYWRENVRVVDPRTADAYLNRGNAFFAKDEMGRAINDYDRALDISPAPPGEYFCRGTAS